MNKKNLIQVEIITEETSEELEQGVNKFLIERRITRDTLIDIKYSRYGGHKSLAVIYEVDLEENK